MNRRHIYSILFIVCMSLTTAVKTNAAEEPSIQQDQAIPIGEHLLYKITWLGIPVGVGELWVKEKMMLAGQEVIHIVGLIGTNSFLSKIFPMHDEAHSWVDAKTFESVQFEKKINEPKTKLDEKTVFDQAKGKGYYESFKTGEKKEFKVTVPIQDFFSVFYWGRRQILTPGKSVKVVLSCDQKDWALEVRVLRLETVKWHGKKIKTLRVEPSTVVEGLEKREKAWFNLTNDASHKPIRIVYKAPFGSVVGTLKND